MTAVISNHLVMETGNSPSQLSSDLRRSVATFSTRVNIHDSGRTPFFRPCTILHDHVTNKDTTVERHIHLEKNF